MSISILIFHLFLDDTSENNLPKFNYVNCDEVEAADFDPDICIKIEFDGNKTKNAILYSDDNLDQIYNGYIIDALDPITVTGHWDGKFSQNSSFLVTVSSDLLLNQKHFTRHSNGSTSYVHYNKITDEIDTETEDISNTAIREDQLNSNAAQTNLSPIPVSGWSLKIVAFYDDTIIASFK